MKFAIRYFFSSPKYAKETSKLDPVWVDTHTKKLPACKKLPRLLFLALLTAPADTEDVDKFK